MPPTPGFSFAPTFDQSEQARRGERSQVTPQQALEVLSFRMKPRVAGAPPQHGSLSPQAGQGLVGSTIGQAVLESVLRTVLGVGGESFAGGPAPVRVHPIDETPGTPNDLMPVDFAEILRRRNNGNTGIGNTGRGPMDPGVLGPAPGTMPPQDFPNPGQGDLGMAPPDFSQSPMMRKGTDYREVAY